MGEARRRGSFEERKKQSIERSRQDKFDAEQNKRRADKRAAERDEGRPVRPHRSGGGRRSPILMMALSAACMVSGGPKK